MEVVASWLTPALVITLFAWLRSELISRTDKLDKRFDAVTRDIADLRERMARLEGALEGFLAGRRDRDAA